MTVETMDGDSCMELFALSKAEPRMIQLRVILSSIRFLECCASPRNALLSAENLNILAFQAPPRVG